WFEAITRPPLPSSWGFLAAMQRRWPRLGDASQRILRILRLVLGRLLAWPVATSARREIVNSCGSGRMIRRRPSDPFPPDVPPALHQRTARPHAPAAAGAPHLPGASAARPSRAA